MFELLLSKKNTEIVLPPSVLLDIKGDTFLDTSSFKRTVAVTGPVSNSTTIKKYLASLRFQAGGGRRLTIAQTTQLDLGTEDFTVECLVYSGRSAHVSWEHLLGKGGGNSAGTWLFALQGGVVAFGTQGNFIYGLTAIPFQTWVSLAAVRIAGKTSLFIEGNRVVTDAPMAETLSCVYDFSIGDRIAGDPWNQYPFVGNLEQIRVTKGIGKYTSNYTPVSLV